MTTISECLLDIERKLATREREKELLSAPTAEILASVKWKGNKTIRTRDSLTKIVIPIFLRFVLHVEKATVLYCCRNISVLSNLLSELRSSWSRRNDKI